MSQPALRRAAAYIRVSRLREDAVSMESQLEKARQWCSLHNAQLLYVEEDDMSGRTDRRPGFQRLMELVRRQEIDLVIIYKIDRFARNVKDFHRHIATPERHGVDLVSISQNFDTSTPIGRLTRNILADFAQFESEMIGERVTDTKRHHAAKGGWNGGQVPYGYRWDDQNKIMRVNETQAIWVRRIFEAYLEGRGSTSIARWLDSQTPSPAGGAWNDHTVRWILRNPMYIGQVRNNDEVFDGEHEPIVSPADFGLVQHRLNTNPRAHSRSPGTHLLTGLIRCGLCGSPSYITYTGPDRYRRYVCSKRYRETRQGCPSPLVDSDSIEEAVADLIMRLASNPARESWIRNQVAATKEDVADGPQGKERRGIEREIERIRGTMQGLFADYYDANIITREQFRDKNQEYLQQLEYLEGRLAEINAELEGTLGAQDNIEAWTTQLDVLRTSWDDLALPERQQALRAIVGRIDYHDTACEIDLFVSKEPLPFHRRRGTLFFLQREKDR